MVVIQGAIPFKSTILEVLSFNAKHETVSLDLNTGTAVWKNPYITIPAPLVPHEPHGVLLTSRSEVEKEEDQKLVDMVEKVDKLQVLKNRMRVTLTDIQRFENKRAVHRSHEVVTIIRNQVITKMHEIAEKRHQDALEALQKFSQKQCKGTEKVPGKDFPHDPVFTEGWRKIFEGEEETVKKDVNDEFNASLTNLLDKKKVFGNIAEINRVVTTRAVKLICLCDSKLYKLQAVRDLLQEEIDCS